MLLNRDSVACLFEEPEAEPLKDYAINHFTELPSGVTNAQRFKSRHVDRS